MSRPVGLAPWNPVGQSAVIIDQVLDVIDEYHDQLPLTGRQIFYRLVGAHGYAKTERDYKALLEKIVRARRAGIVPWGAIRDDGTSRLAPWGYDSPEEFIDSLKDSADAYKRDRTTSQEYTIEVWVEAAGMVPQVQRIAEPLGAAVVSSGGFNSVTAKYQAAQRACRADSDGRSFVVLHVGDHDPSGVSIFDNLSRDVSAMCEDLGYPAPEFVRVAITADQAIDRDLESAPPKRSDGRSANWSGPTWQCEALPPDELADILRDAIEGWVDMDILDDILDDERREREAIRVQLDAIDWGDS